MRYATLLLFFIILPAFFTTVTEAKPKKYTILKEDSQFEFSIYKWVIFKEEGRFKDFNGTIIYDPENLSATTVEINVFVASVDSRNEGRDRAIKSADFFDMANWPILSFKSTQVQPKGKDSLYVQGMLTMKGISKKVTIPIRVTGTNYIFEIGTMVGFEASFNVNREDYGIANGSTFIGKQATIHLLVGASSKD